MVGYLKRLCWFLSVFSSASFAGDQGPSMVSSLQLTTSTSMVTVLLASGTPPACGDLLLPMADGSLGAAFYDMLVTAESTGLPVTVSYDDVTCTVTKVEIEANAS